MGSNVMGAERNMTEMIINKVALNGMRGINIANSVWDTVINE